MHTWQSYLVQPASSSYHWIIQKLIHAKLAQQIMVDNPTHMEATVAFLDDLCLLESIPFLWQLSSKILFKEVQE